MKNNHSRRTFIKSGLIGGGLLALPWWACSPLVGKPDFSLAFMTDIHVNNELDAPKGLAKALNHAKNNLLNPIDFVVTGGDLVYDCLHENQESTDIQYEIFKQVISDSKLEFHHVLGNHEMMGVYEDSGVAPEDPLYGKNYFLQFFNREKTYKSFDHKGWHFILLDTVGINGRDYKGYVDAEQLEWLRNDLEATTFPTVIFGHIPLFTNLWELQSGIKEPDHPKMVIENVDEVFNTLFWHKEKIKLVLAGHLHINEAWLYQGMEFANIGAVCGRWWRGPRHGCEEGFAVLEFRGNDVLWKYEDYGWETGFVEEKDE